MADHTYFSNLIWSIADLLRGPLPPAAGRARDATYDVLRRLDCALAPPKAKVLAEYERFKDRLHGEALVFMVKRSTPS